MNGAFFIGATGLRAQQGALDVVASNIANINTPAFKRSQVRFAQLLGAAPPDIEVGPAGMESLGGVALDDKTRVFAQGDLRQTGDPMALAINGEGFIELLGPEGRIELWRGGTLKVNQDGFLAAQNGMPLRAMISVPAETTKLEIDRSGVVSATSDAGIEEIGRIELVRARDVSDLQAIDDGLFEVSDEANLFGSPAGEEGAGVIVQGSIETSNVQLSDEMVMLLLMQRAYAANAQVVQAGDQLMAIANGLRR
ncbi:MAG TPA: flagellar hook-basal body protein [Phenylobacterium sp.]